MKFKLKGHRFDTIEEIQALSQSAWYSERKGLPESVPKMEMRWDLCLRAGGEYFDADGDLMVNFVIFTSLVRNILELPIYGQGFEHWLGRDVS
jgi:hypothetical protein